MPADLFEHWRAYAGIKPFGHQDRILAHIFARLVNITNKEGSPVVELHDILPYVREDSEIMQSEESRMIEQMNRK